MLTAITPTGDRPLAFDLCQLWMRNQTRKPDQWLVIDDGQAPLTTRIPMEYVRREPQPGEPKPTLLLNLAAAVPLIKGDRIIFIEDDEYYAPGYIECLAGVLEHHLVAGILHSKYYHLPTGKFMQILNKSHASLAETGFQSSFLPEFQALLAGDTYLDMRIWRTAGRRGFLFSDEDNPLYLGIKGLPGRPGIGAGHKAAIYPRTDTPARSMLQRWVPKDFQIYIDFLNGSLNLEKAFS